MSSARRVLGRLLAALSSSANDLPEPYLIFRVVVQQAAQRIDGRNIAIICCSQEAARPTLDMCIIASVRLRTGNAKWMKSTFRVRCIERALPPVRALLFYLRTSTSRIRSCTAARTFILITE